MFTDYPETCSHCCHVNNAEKHKRRGNKGIVSYTHEKLQKAENFTSDSGLISSCSVSVWSETHTCVFTTTTAHLPREEAADECALRTVRKRARLISNRLRQQPGTPPQHRISALTKLHRARKRASAARRSALLSKQT